jgi:hypothetical protein
MFILLRYFNVNSVSLYLSFIENIQCRYAKSRSVAPLSLRENETCAEEDVIFNRYLECKVLHCGGGYRRNSDRVVSCRDNIHFLVVATLNN